jgi:hypothetical protein
MEVSGQPNGPAALPQGKSPSYPLDRRLGGLQSRSGRGGEENNSQGTRIPDIQPVAQCSVSACVLHVLPISFSLISFAVKVSNIKVTNFEFCEPSDKW